MERRVKERLVGASILVVLVVLIVPELLSGPKRASEMPQTSLPGTADPVRSVTVDLATSKATTTDDAGAPVAAPDGVTASAAPATAANGASTPDTDPNADAAPNAESAPTVAVGPTEPAASQSATPPQSATLPQPATPPQAGAIAPNTPHHGWQAQLGSFAARANAERLERQLKAEGFSPAMSATGTGPALRYRVRVGPVTDRAAAEKLVAKLKKAGEPATVVAP